MTNPTITPATLADLSGTYVLDPPIPASGL